MKKIMNFLFGHIPPIFDKNGDVRHDLSHSRWNRWKSQYNKGQAYNWKKHSGKLKNNIPESSSSS